MGIKSRNAQDGEGAALMWGMKSQAEAAGDLWKDESAEFLTQDSILQILNIKKFSPWEGLVSPCPCPCDGTSNPIHAGMAISWNAEEKPHFFLGVTQKSLVVVAPCSSSPPQQQQGGDLGFHLALCWCSLGSSSRAWSIWDAPKGPWSSSSSSTHSSWVLSQLLGFPSRASQLLRRALLTFHPIPPALLSHLCHPPLSARTFYNPGLWLEMWVFSVPPFTKTGRSILNTEIKITHRLKCVTFWHGHLVSQPRLATKTSAPLFYWFIFFFFLVFHKPQQK